MTVGQPEPFFTPLVVFDSQGRPVFSPLWQDYFLQLAKRATGISVHNDLSGLQGGVAGQYYHLTSAQYAAIPGLVTLLSSIAWGLVTESGGTYTLQSNSGIASATSAGTGLCDVVLSTNYASATSYIALPVCAGSASIRFDSITNQTASGVRVNIVRSSTEAAADNGFGIFFIGIR